MGLKERADCGESYHEVKAEFVVECGWTSCLECVLDLKAAGCEDDGKGKPETAVGGESGCTEGVADSHFPFPAYRQRLLGIHRSCWMTDS